MAGIFAGDQLYQWQNLQKFSGASVSYIDDDGLPLYIGADDSGLFWEGEVGRLLIFKRPISDIEYEQFYYEPYCFIEWPSRRIYFDLGAGGPVQLSATIPISSTINASLFKTLGLSGQISASSAVEGLLSLTKRLASSILAQAPVSGTLSITAGLSSLVDVVSGVQPSLSLIRRMQASLPAIAALETDLRLLKSLGGNVVADADVQALLTKVASLRSQISELSALSATLSGGQISQIIYEAAELLLMLEDGEFGFRLADGEFVFKKDDKEVSL